MYRLPTGDKTTTMTKDSSGHTDTPYSVKHSDKATAITIIVHSHGRVEVRAPPATSDATIADIITRNQEWIRKKVRRRLARDQKRGTRTRLKGASSAVSAAVATAAAAAKNSMGKNDPYTRVINAEARLRNASREYIRKNDPPVIGASINMWAIRTAISGAIDEDGVPRYTINRSNKWKTAVIVVQDDWTIEVRAPKAATDAWIRRFVFEVYLEKTQELRYKLMIRKNKGRRLKKPYRIGAPSGVRTTTQMKKKLDLEAAKNIQTHDRQPDCYPNQIMHDSTGATPDIVGSSGLPFEYVTKWNANLKSINVSLQSDGTLTVHAPVTSTAEDVKEFLYNNQEWVEDYIRKDRARERQFQLEKEGIVPDGDLRKHLSFNYIITKSSKRKYIDVFFYPESWVEVRAPTTATDAEILELVFLERKQIEDRIIR